MGEREATWWWLSYADDDGFRGGAFVQAHSFEAACVESKRLGISPGGQVHGTETPTTGPFESGRLYSQEEIAQIDGVVEPFR